MKSNFEQRQQNRLEAFKKLAKKNKALSAHSLEQAHKVSDMIPMGQPIIIGHHSEKRHRRDIQKIDNSMRKSVEADRKAKYYEGRAESLLSNTAISSDDPNAIDKLQEKLEKLEATQELCKQINKVVRSGKISEIEKIDILRGMGVTEETAKKLLIPDRCHGMGIPSYRLTNNGATIRNTKQRIEYLTKIAAIESTEEVINSVRLVISSEDNRVQLFFPSKPSESVRKQLKSNGFKWAPSIGAWMRQISKTAIWEAKNILNTPNS